MGESQHEPMVEIGKDQEALKLIVTCKILPKVRFEILPYCMGPQPSNQGWWQGKFQMGAKKTTSI